MLRELTINRIINLLLQSKHYGDYLKWSHDPVETHTYIVQGLSRLSDTLLHALAVRIEHDNNLIPCSVDSDGQFINVKIGNCYGGMTSDGTIHT